MLKRFDSIDAFLQGVRDTGALDHPRYVGYKHVSRARLWDLGVSTEEAMRLAKEGDVSLVQKAENLVGKHLAHHLASGLGEAWGPSIAGNRVIVPAYLANSPLSMARKQKRDRHVNTMSIYVSTVSEYKIPAEKLLYRGCVILALLSYLQSMRISTDLYMVAELDSLYRGGPDNDGESFVAVQVESRPLDLSVAGFAIAHPAFGRHLQYAYAAQNMGYLNSWPRKWFELGAAYSGTGNSKKYEAHVRQVLDMQPHDIWVPSVVSGDELLNDPEKWLSARISQLKIGDDNG